MDTERIARVHTERTSRHHSRPLSVVPEESWGVLVLESDQVYARLLEQTMRKQGARLGCEVVVASCSALADAERVLQTDQAPEVLVVDLEVPDAPMAALFTHLGALAERVPIVVLANDNDEVSALEALGHGITEYMVKERGAHEKMLQVILRARQRWQINRRHHEEAEREQRERRLVTLGTMAGAVAHEFNNLVTVLLGNLDMVHNEPDLSENPDRGCSVASIVCSEVSTWPMV